MIVIHNLGGQWTSFHFSLSFLLESPFPKLPSQILLGFWIPALLFPLVLMSGDALLQAGCPVHRPSSFPQQFLCRYNLGRSIYGEIGNSETERRRAQSPPFLPPASSLCLSFNHPRNRRFFSQFFPSLNLEGSLHIFMNSLNSPKDLDWKTKSRKTHRLFLFSSRWHSFPEA